MLLSLDCIFAFIVSTVQQPNNVGQQRIFFLFFAKQVLLYWICGANALYFSLPLCAKDPLKGAQLSLQGRVLGNLVLACHHSPSLLLAYILLISINI